MEKLKIGDRVVRLDGQSDSIGFIVEYVEHPASNGRNAYKIEGPGWGDHTADVIWTEDFITLMPFQIGDIVLPKDETENHEVAGRIKSIEENGNMNVVDHFRPGDKRYWAGTYTPDYLRLVDKMKEEDLDELTPLMLELYLA